MTHTIVTHASQFWPDVTRAGAVMAAISSTLATVGTMINRRRLQEVHVLLNGELHGKVQRLEQAADALVQASDAVATIQTGARPGGRRATDPPARDET